MARRGRRCRCVASPLRSGQLRVAWPARDAQSSTLGTGTPPRCPWRRVPPAVADGWRNLPRCAPRVRLPSRRVAPGPALHAAGTACGRHRRAVRHPMRYRPRRIHLSRTGAWPDSTERLRHVRLPAHRTPRRQGLGFASSGLRNAARATSIGVLSACGNSAPSVGWTELPPGWCVSRIRPNRQATASSRVQRLRFPGLLVGHSTTGAQLCMA